MSFENPLKTIAQLGDLFCTVVDIAKAGLGWSTLHNISSVCKEAKDLAKGAVGCFPELKEMSKEDSEALAGASYDLVQKVISKIAH